MIASMPLSTFRFVPGKPTPSRWFCMREISREKGPTVRVSYQGLPLYYRKLPIIVE